MNMGMERWGFLFSVVSSTIVYFLKTTRAVCPNINPIMLCTHVCDVNYAACYLTNCYISDTRKHSQEQVKVNVISLQLRHVNIAAKVPHL